VTGSVVLKGGRVIDSTGDRQADVVIGDDGRIVNTADMQPLDESSHCASEPVRFALEMNQGWFAKRAIKPGFKLKGPPFGN